MEQTQKKIADMTSEELGITLGQMYEQAFQCQHNITAITSELKRRQQKEETNNDETGS